jgi:hypothetical protein
MKEDTWVLIGVGFGIAGILGIGAALVIIGCWIVDLSDYIHETKGTKGRSHGRQHGHHNND